MPEHRRFTLEEARLELECSKIQCCGVQRESGEIVDLGRGCFASIASANTLQGQTAACLLGWREQGSAAGFLPITISELALIGSLAFGVSACPPPPQEAINGWDTCLLCLEKQNTLACSIRLCSHKTWTEGKSPDNTNTHILSLPPSKTKSVSIAFPGCAEQAEGVGPGCGRRIHDLQARNSGQGILSLSCSWKVSYLLGKTAAVLFEQEAPKGFFCNSEERRWLQLLSGCFDPTDFGISGAQPCVEGSLPLFAADSCL